MNRNNPEIDSFGHKYWRNESSEYHRDEDGLPAVEWTDGTKFWFRNGRRYRERGLPIVEYVNGSKYWYDEVGLTVCRYDSWKR